MTRTGSKPFTVRLPRRCTAVMATVALALAGCSSESRAAQNGSSSVSPSAPALSSTTTPTTSSTISSSGTPSTSPGVAATGTTTDTPSYEAFTVMAGPPPAEADPPVSAVSNTGTGFQAPLSVAWAKSGQILFVTTYGSSSCPSVVEAQIQVISTRPQRLTLRTSNPDKPRGTAPQGCTMDLVPTTSTVPVPAEINPTKPVTVEIDGRTLVLPGRR